MTTGHWVELEVSWHETNVVQCALCGRLIPRRAWLFDGGEGEIVACAPECEELYETYWKPTYGVMEADGHYGR